MRNWRQRLARALADSGLHPKAVRAALGAAPAAQCGASAQPRRIASYCALPSHATTAAGWSAGCRRRGAIPGSPPVSRAATLLLYLLVLGAGVWIAMRLARPLRDLTRAADAFGGRTEPVDVPVRGPSDLRSAIEAFNAMNRRVLAPARREGPHARRDRP